jgi:nucleotide-binding universal stress UspA family protein
VDTSYRRLLCPTDFSAIGDDAVDLAYALAPSGATVILLHVCEPAFVLNPVDGTPVGLLPLPAEIEQRETQRATAHLRHLVPESSLDRNVRSEHVVIHDTASAAVIVREAVRASADVIVLGTHGRTGIGRALLGSVAAEVGRRSPVPVVLYRPAGAPARR